MGLGTVGNPGSWGTELQEQEAQGARSQQGMHSGKGPNGKAIRVKTSLLGLGVGRGITWGVLRGSYSCGLAMWVEKPLGSSTAPPEAYVI